MQLWMAVLVMTYNLPRTNNIYPSSTCTTNACTMSAYIQNVGVKLFRQHLEQYAPADPVYEYYNDAKGKQRRKKVITASKLRIRFTGSFFSSFFLIKNIYSADHLPASPPAMPKSSRQSNGEPVVSTRVSISAVSSSVGPLSLASFPVPAMSHVPRSTIPS